MPEDETPATADGDELRQRRRAIWRDFAFGLIVMFVLIGAHSLVERSWIGEPLRNYWLGISERAFTPQAAPVVVFDIHDLAAVAPAIGADHLETPRDALTALVKAIDQKEPAAIGIDIDMSSFDGSLEPANARFFRDMLQEEESEHVPIYLGVYRTVGNFRKNWLNDERYAELGAALTTPEDPTRLLATIDDPSDAAQLKPTLAFALAAAYARPHREELPDLPGYLATRRSTNVMERLIDRVDGSDSNGADLSGLGYLVDYSLLSRNAIDVRPVRVDDNGKLLGVPIDSEPLGGKIVIIGDALPADDPVLVPWQRKLVSGTMLHASGAYTLAANPLYELADFSRVALDVLTSVLALGLVAAIRLAYARKPGVRVRETRLKYALAVTLALAMVALCLWFDSSLRVVWDDFVLVALLIAVHPVAERWFEGAGRWVRWAIPAGWDAAFVEHQASEAPE